MPRRGTPGVQVLVAVGLLLLFLYGYYSYNELKSTIRKNEEAAKRMALNEENLLTQLQVLNEQRNQLEQSIKSEKDNSKRTIEETLLLKADVDLKCKKEKDQLNDNMEITNAELTKLKADHVALQQKCEVSDMEKARLENEMRRMQQESSNEIAVFRDQVADLKRQNDALKEHVKRKTIDSYKVAKGGKKSKNSVLTDDAVANVQQQWKADDNRIPQLGGNNAQKAENGEEKSEDRMQIRGPDEDKKPAYFIPKSAKPDHVIQVIQPTAANNNVAIKAQPNFPEQVVPPDVDAGNKLQQPPPQQDAGQEQANVVLEHERDRFGRADKVRPNPVNNFVRQVNPVMPADEGRLMQRLDADPKESNGGKQWGVLRGQVNAGRGQVEKPRGIAVPQLNHEEDQLQGPAAQNQQDADEKDEGRENNEENEEDYRYEEKKVQKKNAIDGPHAAPVEEDDLAEAEGGLR